MKYCLMKIWRTVIRISAQIANLYLNMTINTTTQNVPVEDFTVMNAILLRHVIIVKPHMCVRNAVDNVIILSVLLKYVEPVMICIVAISVKKTFATSAL